MIVSYFPLYLAGLLTKTASHERSISIMARLCFWGICISTCALSLVAAVMYGFEQVTQQSIKGMHADLIIRSAMPLNYDKISSVIQAEFANEIEAISPTSLHHAIIDTNDDQLTIAYIEAIDPQTAAQVNDLEKIITTPRNVPLHELLQNNSIIIGKALAENLHKSIGDTITLLHPSEHQSKKNRISLESAKAHVSGIFSTGIDELDAHGIIASHAFITQVLEVDNAITQINIKLRHPAHAAYIQKKLSQRLSLNVVSWKDLYPQLISALALEKYAMIFILSLIVLIASMNTISLLFMFIAQKKQTIGLLFAMGMSRRAISSTFIALGMGITSIAAIIGLFGAIILSYLLDHYQLIRLPTVYYPTYLPAHMNITIIIAVLVLTLILGFFAAWYPTQTVNRKKIAQILKFDT